MQDTENTTITTPTEVSQCPVGHSAWSWQKTARDPEPVNAPAIERDKAGVWHVHSFEIARTILRSADTKQAGFNAETIARIPTMINVPVLYQQGKVHQEQRKQIARFFAPKTVSDNYRQIMETFADRIIKKLERQKQADLSDLSLAMAVRVAGQVVGLTNSYPGMAGRLAAFFKNNALTLPGFTWHPRVLLHTIQNQVRTLAFFYLDVVPAIRARKRRPQNDVISHLLAQNYNKVEILTECLIYGAAGMVTTREFILIAVWHFLEHPELRTRYLSATEEERHEMLHEVLRLEPIVSHLYRHAMADLEITSDGNRVVIAQGDKIDIHIYGANEDQKVVGDLPLALCPGRELKGNNIPTMLMSFGDGAHRCPGAYIAILESDIFLRRLLAIDSLRIVSKPSITWDDTIATYELRTFTIAVD